MRIHLPASHRPRPSQSGFVVIVILAMLAIMAILVASNTRTVNWLRAEVRLVDQHQTARLAASATNQVVHPLVNPATAP